MTPIPRHSPWCPGKPAGLLGDGLRDALDPKIEQG
jgi:hypothetical protein